MWRRRCEDDKDIKQDLSVFRENAGDNEKSYPFFCPALPFDMMSFGALAMVFSGLTDGFTTSMIWMIFGITLASMLLKIYCSYISDFGKVQIGYFMCAEKRIHIGDRMKYMPMGYFNDHNLGNLTSVVTTTMGDIENNASMVLTNILGGYIHAAIITIVMLCIDWRIGLTILCGILLFTWCIGRLQKKSETVSPLKTAGPGGPSFLMCWNTFKGC